LRQSLTLPVPIPFNNEGQAAAYVQTDDIVAAFAYFYPSTSTGHYLANELTAPFSSRTVDLDSEMVKITPPSGYDQSTVSVRGGAWLPTWYVTKGAVTQGRVAISQDDYRYEFTTWIVAEQNQQVALSKSFIGYAGKYELSAGDTNQYLYQSFEDERGNELTKVSRIAQPPLYAPQSEMPVQFEMLGPDGPVGVTAENTGDEIVYRQFADASVAPGVGGSSGGGSGGGTSTSGMFEYQLYDSSNRPVGNKWFTDSTPSFQWSVPNVYEGDYVLRVKQNFPEDVIRLTGEIGIRISNMLMETGLTIPIAIPNGYSLHNLRYSNVEVRTKTGNVVQNLEARMDENTGVILVKDKNAIVPSQDYLILLGVNLVKGSDNSPILYHHKIELKGSELLALDQVDAPLDLVEVNQARFADSPSVILTNMQYFMPTEGFGSAFVLTPYPAFVSGKLLVSPGEYAVNLLGTDPYTAGISILKKIKVDSSEVTVTNGNQHRIRLSGSHPFTSFIIFYAEYPSWLGAGYDSTAKRMLNELYVTEGVQTIG